MKAAVDCVHRLERRTSGEAHSREEARIPEGRVPEHGMYEGRRGPELGDRLPIGLPVCHPIRGIEQGLTPKHDSATDWRRD